MHLGRTSPQGEQKGVDLRIGLDLAAHGRNRSVDVIYLLSGDDDLSEAVEELQRHGTQVVLGLSASFPSTENGRGRRGLESPRKYTDATPGTLMKNAQFGLKIATASAALVACLSLTACGGSAPISSAQTASATTAAATPTSATSTTPDAVETTAEDVAAAEPTTSPTPMPANGKTPNQADSDKLFLIAAKAQIGDAPDSDLLSLRDSICEKLRDDPTSARYKQLVDAASGTGSGDMSANTVENLIRGSVMSGCWDARAALPAKDLADLKEISAGGPSTSITEGVWEVGSDIKPGRYRTDDAVTDCYWAITRGGSNGEDIIANDNVSGGRPSVTLKRGQEFKSSRCGDWTLIK
ncbi:NYN domain-containing protein [Terrabacter sp. BE26]|uniref:NYN domain-containing protein n=1 Tax=Terrabacter sp. BE26 TaxID=2898152 RepID=UPI0035BE5377